MQFWKWWRRSRNGVPRTEPGGQEQIAEPPACDIFLSYSSHDRNRVLPLKNHFAECGYSVFWDQEVPKGSNWNAWIGSHLAAAKCVIVVWTPSSATSHNVYHEAEIARQGTKLIPVMLDSLRADQFPMGFYTVQCANLTEWKGGSGFDELRKLDAQVERLLGAAPDVFSGRALSVVTCPSFEKMHITESREIADIWHGPCERSICTSKDQFINAISRCRILHVEANIQRADITFKDFKVTHDELRNAMDISRSDVKVLFLSTCDSFRVGAALEGTSVKYLLAGADNVEANYAREFILEFYAKLDDSNSIREAFRSADLRTNGNHRGRDGRFTMMEIT